MDEKKRAPKLRFKGFTDDWEQRKFGDLVFKLSKTSNIRSLPNITYDDIVSKENSLNKNITELTHGKKGIYFSKDDILFGKLRPYLENILLAKFNGIAVGDFWVFSPKDNNISSFLFDLIQTSRYKYISNLSSGSKMPRSDWNLVSKASFWIPAHREQNKIGKIFQLIDNLISLQQRKLDQLKLLKKAMLQNMFTKESTPSLRFIGFYSNWNVSKLQNITKRLDNARVPISASKRVSGVIPYYGANGIQDHVKGYTHNGEYLLIAEDGANDVKNYPIHYVKGKIWVNNHAHVLQVINNKSDILFLLYALKTLNMEKYLVGGSRAKLNAAVLMKLPIKSPELIEQHNIGSLLMHLDTISVKCELKIKRLKQIKQFLLQNMFI